jgi:hypothetical protein
MPPINWRARRVSSNTRSLRVYPARDPLVVATFIAVELSDQQIVVAAVEVDPI